VFSHKYAVETYVAARGKPFARFSDGEWMWGFTSVVDIPIHLNELNTAPG